MAEPKYIVTHGGRAHFDDLMSVSLLLYKYPSSCVIRENNLDNLSEEIMNNAVIVDISGKYDGKKFFDHHQDLQLNSSFVLVLKHFFDIDLSILYPIFSYYQFYDLKDRFGPEKALSLMNITCSDTTFYLSPIEDYIISEEFSKRNVIYPDDWFHNVLRKLGEYFLKNIKKQLEDIKSFKEIVEVKIISGYKCALSLSRGFPLIYYKKLLDDIIIIIQENDRDKNHINLISLDTEKINFLKLKNTKLEYIFVHPNGFLAVIDKKQNYEQYINAVVEEKKEG